MAANIVHRRNFRERKDCLQQYSDRELIERFRLDSGGILFVESLIRDQISSGSRRNMALSSLQKVLLTLRFLATGKMQLCNGDDMGVSQPTVSRAITVTLASLTSPLMISRFVQFPSSAAEIRRNQESFHAIAGFPGIVGAIDGTHIQIIAPHEYENEFVNRHNYHSINTQVVFDAKYRIIDVVAKWPGSTHDSRILNESGLRVLFENNHIPIHTHLLGDSGYPSKRWLLTPFLRPNQPSQLNYNRAHKKTRSVVERGIGQLKRRFHVLHGEIRLSPEKACQVILSCAILHNICKDRCIPCPQDHEDDGEDQQVNVHVPHIFNNNGNDGLRYRQQFAETHF
ncbi:putative nuclease HARBI1 [Ostrea edulis]|uniref:putative nuclease HARBI1 n=1 Tax=Ostrea edulis TaxID=37623 RepID=UPI0024AE983B|nr:putative nuclease HARBI1 [Ostrea edulis]